LTLDDLLAELDALHLQVDAMAAKLKVPPSISGLTANPSSLPAGGGSVTINATVTNASRVLLDGSQVTLPVTVNVPASHQFTLTAHGKWPPDATATVSVTVAQAAPAQTIDLLTVSSPSITAGQSVTVNWATSNATALRLNGAVVNPSGSQTFAPSADTTYTVEADGAVPTVSRAVSVSVAQPGPSPTPGQPEPYLTSDTGVGSPTPYSMVEGFTLPWPSMRPWVDAAGVKGGTSHYAKQTFAVGRYAIDVTTLIRALLTENKGISIAPTTDTAMNIAGRLADDVSTRPSLHVVSAGGAVDLPCQYLCRYFPNAVQGAAATDTSKVCGLPGSIALGLVRFDLTGIADVVSATLNVTCTAVAGSNPVLAFNVLDAPKLFEGNGGMAPVQGIAQAFAFDQGLASHPDVLFVGDFANKAMWHYGTSMIELLRDDALQSNIARGGIKVGGGLAAQDIQMWLDGVVIDGSNGGKPKNPSWPSMYLRYYIYLEDDFFSDPFTGWKCPGVGVTHGYWSALNTYPLGGYWNSLGRGPVEIAQLGTRFVNTDPVNGAAGGVWNYYEGSLRGAILPPKPAGHPYAGLMGLGGTPYHLDMTAYDGGIFSVPAVVVRRKKWYCLEWFVQVNTIDTANFTADQYGNYPDAACKRDGVIRLWVDGRLCGEVTNLAFVRNPALGCRGLDGNWYYGGQHDTLSDQHFQWRDVVIAKSYIGPRNEGASPPDPTPVPDPVPVPNPTPTPAPTGVPSWVPGAGELAVLTTTNTYESQNPNIPGCASEFHRTVDDYSGGVYNPYWGTLGCMVFHGGGHAGTSDNSVVILDYNDLTFKRIGKTYMTPPPIGVDIAGSQVDPVTGENPDGSPASPHSWDILAILPPSAGGGAYGTLITPHRQALNLPGQWGTDYAHAMDFAPGQSASNPAVWRRFADSTLTALTPGGTSAYDSKRNRIWYWHHVGGNQAIRYLDIATKQRVVVRITGTDLSGSGGVDAPMLRYDATRDILIFSTIRDSGGAAFFQWLDCANPARGWSSATLSSAIPAPPTWAPALPFDYVPELDAFIVLASYDQPDGPHAVYEVRIPTDKAQTWNVTRRPFAGLSSMPTAYVVGKRWSYAPAVKAFVYMPKATGWSGDLSRKVYVYRPVGT
jgi:hypothetical protein